jgi:hypothetical protein
MSVACLSLLTVSSEGWNAHHAPYSLRSRSNLGRESALVEQNDEVQCSSQEHSLFSVTGRNRTGHATTLIIAATKAVAEYYALHELGFVAVSATMLVSDAVYVVGV